MSRHGQRKGVHSLAYWETRKWWLTDVQQRRKQDAVNAADEDGPASESDGGKEETEDEDPTSDEECEDTSLPASSSKHSLPQWAKPNAHSDSN